MADLTYNPAVFATPTLKAAKHIILTPDPGFDTETRWARETPYLANLAVQQLDLNAESLLLDYGCGVGRLAKAIIERAGCQVLGVDISEDMRSLAPAYVADPRFSVVSRNVFSGLISRGLKVDAAISVWVLQHCPRVEIDLSLILQALREGSRLFVVNAHNRAIPVIEKPWASDGIDVQQLLAERARMKEIGQLDPIHVGPHTADGAFWCVSTPIH